MDVTAARKVVILCYLLVIGIFTFGGLWGQGQLPHPRKFLGATIAYMGLAVAADFVAPVAGAFAILFALYILTSNLPEVEAIGKAASSPTNGTVAQTNTSGSTTTPPGQSYSNGGQGGHQI